MLRPLAGGTAAEAKAPVPGAARRGGPPSLVTLPWELQESIFLRLPLLERVRVLPLISRATRDGCRGSQRLWAEVYLPAWHVDTPARVARVENFIRCGLFPHLMCWGPSAHVSQQET